MEDDLKPDFELTFEELDEEELEILRQLNFEGVDRLWKRLFLERLQQIRKLKRKTKSVIAQVYE